MNIFTKYLPLSRQIFFSISLLLIISLGIFSSISSHHVSKSYVKQKNDNIIRESEILSRQINYVFRHENVLSPSTFKDESKSSVRQALDIMASSSAIGIDIYSTTGTHLYKSSTDYSATYHDIPSSSAAGESLSSSLAGKIDSLSGGIFIPEHIEDSIAVVSIYSILYNKSGERIGLSRFIYPETYLTSSVSADVSRRMSETLVILIAVALLISLFISRSITRPLRDITKALTDTSATGTTSPISGSVPLELRGVTDAYNTMLTRIENQTQDIAHSEKEHAWQQMAKIVAHEINNPLTPMRLSIQRHQMTFDPSSPHAAEDTEKLCHMLIQQIDTLSRIASSFASFSSSQDVSHEGRCNVSTIVRDVAGLYTGKNIHTCIRRENMTVPLDATAVVQIMSNMIKNALEAARADEPIRIDITVDECDSHAVISVKDNGSGIPSHALKDIFSPSFTTKTSGMGMGLSITEKIVHEAHGDISCISTGGKGTEFYIKIPLISQ